MDSVPSPHDTAPERARESARSSAASQRSRQTAGGGGGVSDRRASAYTPKPDFAGPANEEKPARTHRWLPWVAAMVAAGLLLAGGGLALRHPHAAPVSPEDSVLTLETGDIDPAATTEARDMLAHGQIPPSLARASEETRRAVADGKQSLYTKQLLPPESPAGVAVRVTVSKSGEVIAEDTLTSDHPRTTTFPAGPGSPAHFHFLVESAGPSGSVTCWANSAGGVAVRTPPMSKGGSGDLEAVGR